MSEHELIPEEELYEGVEAFMIDLTGADNVNEEYREDSLPPRLLSAATSQDLFTNGQQQAHPKSQHTERRKR